jgi:ABC-type multidrug transport system fused ATPase/permease subunit
LSFGSIIDALAGSSGRPRSDTWRQILLLLGLWGLVGVGSIGAGILVALHADRLAQRRRLAAMSQYFRARPAAAPYLPQRHAFGPPAQDHVAGRRHPVRLSFLRENLATFAALCVLPPLTLLLNWRLGALLMLLILVTGALTWFVIRRTHAAQARVEAYHTALTESAGDAFGNVVLVQSFGRLAAETRRLRAAMDEMLAAQFPVLNWWALVTVLSGASSTITLIANFALGTWLHLHDRATVGEIVTFVGLATQLIGRVDQAIGFINRLFFHAPRLAEFFAALDTQSAIVERADALRSTGCAGTSRSSGSA